MPCALLKGVALQAALAAFWAKYPPKSFYFLPEAVEFCDFLLAQGRQPLSVERRPCIAVGVCDSQGQAQWTLQD